MTVIFHTTTRSTQSLRHWDKWSELADWMVERYECNITLTGNTEYNSILARECRNGVDFWFGDLDAFAEKIKGCDFLVTVNSFPMHLGVCFKIPMLAIVGATDPTVVLPNYIDRVASRMASSIPLIAVQAGVRRVLERT